jgi:PST family polysaccharide transporter
MGGSFTILTIFGAPLIAEFYHEGQLASIAKIWGLAFILTALSCQHAALLRRELMFRKIALIEIAANVGGAGGAIGIALNGGGYWALVWRPVLTAFFTLVLVWLNCRWIPGMPAYSRSVRETIKFGLHVTGFTITDYVARAVDRVGLGYMTSAKDLGYYQNASTVHENAVTVLAHPLHSVAVATLSKLRDNLDELRASWATALSSLAFFGMPAFVILAVIGPDLLVLLLGEKWASAGVILIAFAIRGPAQIVERTLGWLHIAAGRADRWARWGVFSCIVQVVAILCGLPFGTIGVATSFTICMYLLFVPAILYAGSPVGIKASHLWSAIAPQLFGSIVAAGVGLALRFSYLANLSRFERMSILILQSIAVYLFITVICFKVTRPLEIARKLVFGFLPLRVFNLGKSAK